MDLDHERRPRRLSDDAPAQALADAQRELASLRVENERLQRELASARQQPRAVEVSGRVVDIRAMEEASQVLEAAQQRCQAQLQVIALMQEAAQAARAEAYRVRSGLDQAFASALAGDKSGAQAAISAASEAHDLMVQALANIVGEEPPPPRPARRRQPPVVDILDDLMWPDDRDDRAATIRRIREELRRRGASAATRQQ